MYFWQSYWWLIFPVGGFAFAIWERWLSYQRSRDALEVIKSYTAQGKEPPPELLRRVQDDIDDEPDSIDRYSRRAARRARRYYRWGPYREWRSVIVTGAIAGAFWLASTESYIPGTEGPFRFVAIILTCVAGANFAFALLTSSFRDR